MPNVYELENKVMDNIERIEKLEKKLDMVDTIATSTSIGTDDFPKRIANIEKLLKDLTQAFIDCYPDKSNVLKSAFQSFIKRDLTQLENDIPKEFDPCSKCEPKQEDPYVLLRICPFCHAEFWTSVQIYTQNIYKEILEDLESLYMMGSGITHIRLITKYKELLK